jgi:plastocyanin
MVLSVHAKARRIFFGSVAFWGCVAVQAGSIQVQVVDGAGQPLADAVVFLDSPAAKALVKPVLGMEIEQVSRQFAPRVTVMPVGSMVQFPNRDTVRHHVYSFSPTKNFELKLYAGNPSNPVLFDKPGVVVLGCNIHDQMVAWMLVVETPYYGKTNAAGQLTLSGVPAGNYRLHTWHAGLPVGAPAQEQPLNVTSADANVVVNLKGVSL